MKFPLCAKNGKKSFSDIWYSAKNGFIEYCKKELDKKLSWKCTCFNWVFFYKFDVLLCGVESFHSTEFFVNRVY